MVHIIGLDLKIEGRYHRQRCAWCGTKLIDEDFANMAMPEPWIEPKGFPVSRLVRVIEGNPRVFELLNDTDKLPDDACAILIRSLTESEGQDTTGKVTP